MYLLPFVLVTVTLCIARHKCIVVLRLVAGMEQLNNTDFIKLNK